MSDENIQPCLSLRVVRTEVDHFYFPIFTIILNVVDALVAHVLYRSVAIPFSNACFSFSQVEQANEIVKTCPSAKKYVNSISLYIQLSYFSCPLSLFDVALGFFSHLRVSV